MFLFGKRADIKLELSNDGSRKVVKSTNGNECYIYYDGETVSGKVIINVFPGKKLEHQGVIIELCGKIDFLYDRGSNQDFLTLERDLARPGILMSGQTCYNWEFKNVEKPYESYSGVNVNLRYVVIVHILQRFANIVREVEFEVQTLSQYSKNIEPLRMEVGIEESLHIEFEYNTTRFHLEDVIVGKIYFILVRVKIKSMDIQIIRHETVGRGPSVFVDSTYMNKYEIMDGAPSRGESIPVRIFIRDMKDLRPTMIDIANCFSVRYFLNLVLTDEEDRRYYKQQEIFLYRRFNKRFQSIASTSKVVQSLIEQGHLKNFVSSSKPDVVETNKLKVGGLPVFPNDCDESQYEVNGDVNCRYIDNSSESDCLKSPDIMESCKIDSN